MFYWNQPNFESLLAIADCLDGIDGCEKLAKYCRLRERGLRKPAFAELRQYIDMVNSLDTVSIRRHCRDVIELDVRNDSAHQFLTNPLYEQLLKPALVDWAASCPRDPFAIKWHAIMNREPELLKVALELNDKDTHLRRMMINRELGDVEFAMHHLDEDSFIGDVPSVENSLRIAAKLLEPVNEDPAFSESRTQISELTEMLSDWMEFEKTNTNGFGEWCAERGKQYWFPKKFYY